MSKQGFFRKLSFLLALVMVMSSLCVPVMADTEETVREPEILGDSSDLRGSGFTFTSDGSEMPATITGYEGNSWSNLVIPEVVTDENGDHNVGYIKKDAFNGETRLDGKLTLSKDLWVLNGAFKGCTNLKTLIIDKKIDRWSEDAFSGCSGLTKVINYSNEEFKFYSHVGDYGKKWYNSNNTEVDRIKEGTATREDYTPTKYTVTFWDDKVQYDQKEVEEDEKVKRPTPDPVDPDAPEWVFEDWYTDEELTKPYDFDKPVTKDFDLFAGWTKKAGSGILFYDQEGSGFWFTINEDGKTATIARQKPVDKVNDPYTLIETDLIIPEVVSESGIKYTVTGVGESAFEGKGYTGELVFPDTLTDIGNRAFYGCKDLTGDLVFPDGLKTIGDSAFMMPTGDSKLNGTLDLGSSLVSIGNNAFEFCNGLTGDIIFPDTVESVGDYAFCECTGLEGTIYLGKSLKTIGKYAFAGSENHSYSNFTGGIEIPATVTTIGEYAFYNAQYMEGRLSIPLSGNLVDIGDKAFGKCSKLQGNLTFPQKLKNIGDEAFKECKALSGNIIIPDSVLNVGGWAFLSCSGLGETVVIGENVQRIDKSIISGVDMSHPSFAGCSGIKRVINKSDKVVVELETIISMGESWTDAAGNVIKTIGKGVAYRSDYTGERIDPNDPNNPDGTVSGNKASDVKEEEVTVEGIEGVDKVLIIYPHKIPFFGKSKIDVDYFTKDGGKFTVSFNQQEYAVKKIKVNKKKKKIQVQKLENADKKVEKAIKKATKGDHGLPYETTPYVVSDSDEVIVKFNKKAPDTIKSAKVKINNKFFNIKNKNECLVYNPVVSAVTFKHEDVIGSSTTYKTK